MTKSKPFIVASALFTWSAMCAGCGGAASLTDTSPPKEAPPQGNIDPLGADNADLKAEKTTITAVYEPNDVSVPGAEYGLKPQAEVEQKQGKKGRGKKAMKSQGIPNTDAIKEQMEGLPWGLKYTSVLAYFEQQIRKTYEPDLKSATGAIEEDRIRSRMLRDIERLRESYIEFKGQRTGFEGSLIESEFTHNNGESMLMYDAGKYVEYMFFFEGRFWKRIRAFRKDELQGLDFESYVSTLINRFGEGREVYNDKGEFAEIKWKDKSSYMSAEDRSSFYGVYVLIFTARLTQDNLAKLRKNADREGGGPSEKVSGMVTAATGGEASDSHTSVIDSYTGRSSSPAPAAESSVSADDSSSGAKKAKPKPKKKAAEEPSTTEESGKDIIDDLF